MGVKSRIYAQEIHRPIYMAMMLSIIHIMHVMKQRKNVESKDAQELKKHEL